MGAYRYDEPIPIPRGGIRFPLELVIPEGFEVSDLATWPRVFGRLEFVEERLLSMPPWGGLQQTVCTDVVVILGTWVQTRPDFIVGGNEAGMLLSGEVRGADAAVWRRKDVEVEERGFRRVPPVLVAEVSGIEENEALLQSKARWYLDHGVTLVWLVLHTEREVVVITKEGQTRHRSGAIPEHPALPGLMATVNAFFHQLRL